MSRLQDDPEMRLVGTEDGEVLIECHRQGCMVPGNCQTRLCYLQIKVPYNATPATIWDMWHLHRIDHASRDR